MNKIGAMGTRRQIFNNNHNNHIGIIKENPEYNVAILGALGVGKSGTCVFGINRNDHESSSQIFRLNTKSISITWTANDL